VRHTRASKDKQILSLFPSLPPSLPPYRALRVMIFLLSASKVMGSAEKANPADLRPPPRMVPRKGGREGGRQGGTRCAP